MAGKARDKYGLGKKLKHQQDTNKELYNISGAVPTQASSSVVSAGSQGGGTYQNAQSADIYMNTYDIVDIDRLKFAVKEGSGDLLSNTDYGIEALYVSGDAYGMWFRIPAISAEGNNTQYIFYHGDTQMVHISLAEIVLNNDVRIEGFVDVDNIAEPSSPSGGDRRLFVDSGNSDHLSVKKSDGNVVDLEAGGGVTNPVNAPLSLGGNQITRVTSLFFDGDGNNSHSIQGNTGGINYLVDNTDEYHDFKIDGNIKLRVGNGSIQPTEIIDMQDNGIQNVPHIYLNTDATNEALIDGATNGIDFNVPALDFYQFKFNNVTKWSMTTTQLGGDNIILNQSLVFNNSSSDPSANGEITRNGNYLKVQTDGLVKDLTCVSGYKDSTSSQSVGTNTTLDGWFGDVDGCVGVQYNSSASAGTGKYRIWIRANGGWYKAEAY